MKAQPDINDTLRTEGPDAVARAARPRAHQQKANGKAHHSLDDIHAVFRKWLGEDYDLDALDAVLAAAAAENG